MYRLADAQHQCEDSRERIGNQGSAAFGVVRPEHRDSFQEKPAMNVESAT